MVSGYTIALFSVLTRVSRINIAKLLNVSTEQTKKSTQDKSRFAALVDRVVASVTSW